MEEKWLGNSFVPKALSQSRMKSANNDGDKSFSDSKQFGGVSHALLLFQVFKLS